MNIRINDLAGNKEQQRQRWDSVAVGWKKWWPIIENGARNVSERMVELAEIESGQRVLDVATGIGEPALLVASRVGPAGFVVATDISSRMLAIAQERAMALGVTNVKFMKADAERLAFHEGSFDAILWRWGPADLPDPSNALAAIRRMLKPKGSFVASAWEAGPRARPLANLAMMVAQELFDMPADVEPPCPPEDGLGKQMTCAGFSDVRLEEMTLTLSFASADDCISYLLDVSPDFAALLSGKGPSQQAEYRHRLAEKVRRYMTTDGSVRIPNVTLCAAGRK